MIWFSVRPLLLMTAIAVMAGSATAQTFAPKLIRIILPVGPGGSADLAARTIAQRLQTSLNTPVIVENRHGGGGQVGVEAVMLASPDGQTILLAPNGYVTIMGGFRENFPDPRKALAPIIKLIDNPFAIAVTPSLPVKTLEEFLKYARERPGELNYAVPALGTHVHLVGEMFRMVTGVKMVAIPYRGTAAATTALLSGDVQATISDLATLLPLAESGKVRLLASTDATRTVIAPDLPTVAEAGFPGFGTSGWLALFAPAGTSADIVALLNREVAAILNAADVRATFLRSGMVPAPNTPAEMSEIVSRDIERWAKLVKDANIRFK